MSVGRTTLVFPVGLLFTTVTGGLAFLLWHPSGVDWVRDVGLPIVITWLAASGLGLLAIRGMPQQRQKELWRIFLTSLAVRMAMGSVINQWSLASGGFGSWSSPITGGLSDDWTFHLGGLALARIWANGGSLLVAPSMFVFQPGEFGYEYLLAAIYSVFGPSPLMAIFVNSIFGGLIAIYAYHLAFLILDERCAKLAGWLTALNPRLIWLSAVLGKDAILVLAILLFVYTLLSTIRGNVSLQGLVALVMTWGIVLMTRSPVALLLISIPVVSLILMRSRVSSSRAWLILVVIVLSGTLMNLCAVLPAVVDITRGRLTHYLQSISSPISATAWASSLSLQDDSLSALVLSTPARDIITHPYLVPVILLFSIALPLPFSVPVSPAQLLTGPGNIIWYAIVTMTSWGIWVALKQKSRESLLLILVIMMLWVSVVLASLGTQSRYMTMLMPFASVFAALGAKEWRSGKAWYVACMYLAGIMVIFYISWKYLKEVSIPVLLVLLVLLMILSAISFLAQRPLTQRMRTWW